MQGYLFSNAETVMVFISDAPYFASLKYVEQLEVYIYLK